MHPDGAFIVAGDLITALWDLFHQNVSCTTRGHKTCLHQCGWCLQSHTPPPLGIVMTISHCSCSPSTPWLIKHMKPSTRTVKIWFEDADAALATSLRFSLTLGQTLYWITSTGVWTVWWVTTQKKLSQIRSLLLKARDAAFRSGDWEAYSSARDNLRRGISQTKQLQTADWRALQLLSPLCGKAQTLKQALNIPALCPQPGLLPSPMSSTTSKLALTREIRWPSSKQFYHPMSGLSHSEQGECTEGSWPWRNTWPRVQSLCRAAGWGLYGHFQCVPGPGSCPHKFQDCLHRASAKVFHCYGPEWLPSWRSHPHNCL